MANLKVPEGIDFNVGNVAENWEQFLDRFTWFLKAEYPEAGGARKVALLLNVAGTTAQHVFKTLVFAPAREVGGNQVAAESKDD